MNHVRIFSISDERPVIIELIDRDERISDFSEIAVSLLKKAGSGGLIYIEDVNVISYTHSKITMDN